MTTFQEFRAVATSALHTTVRIHSKTALGVRWYQVYKNGVQVLESKDWNVVKECAVNIR